MSLQNQSQSYAGDAGASTSSNSGPFTDGSYLTARAEFLSPADVLKQVKLGTDRCGGGGFDPASYWAKPEHSYHPQHPPWGFSSDHVPSATATGSAAGLIGIGGFGAGEPLQATAGYNTGLFVPNVPVPTTAADGIAVQHSQERSTQSGGEQGPLQCPHCARTFSRRQNLAMHVTWQHGDGSTGGSSSSSDQRSFRCEIEGCGKTFRRRNNLTQHTKLHHQPPQQQQAPPPPQAPPPQPPPAAPFSASSKPGNPSHFGCLDGMYAGGRSLVGQQLPGGFTTNVAFNYGSAEATTSSSSSPNKSSNCNGESGGSNKRSGWNRHARRGASEVSPEDVASGAAATVYECPHCSRSFTKRQSLGLHITWSHNPDGKAERTFLCERPGCEKAFRRKSSLAQHLKFHEGLKTEICPTCGKGFVHRYELNRHRKYHPQDTSASSSDAGGGNPRHICSGCGQAFNRGAQLTIHRRTHPSCCPNTPASNFNQHIDADSLQVPRTEPATATTTTTTTTSTTALPYQQVHPSSNLPPQPSTAITFSPHFPHLQQKENPNSLHRPNQALHASAGLVQHPYVPAGAGGGFVFSMSSVHHNNHATQTVNHESLIGNVAAALLDKALDKAAAVGCMPPGAQQHLLQASMADSISSERESPSHHSMDTLLSNASSESHPSNTTLQHGSAYSPLDWHTGMAPKLTEMHCTQAVTSMDNTEEKRETLQDVNNTVKEQKKAIWRKVMLRCQKQKQVVQRMKSLKQLLCSARKEYCNMCGIQLSTRGMLVLHLRWSHSNTRPWNCQKCNKKFVCSGAVLQHAIASHQEGMAALCLISRQYTDLLHRCRTCSRTFHSRASLKTHRRRREGPKECLICKKRFHTCRGLEVHREKAHKLVNINGIVAQKSEAAVKTVKRLSANGSVNSCVQHPPDSSLYTFTGLSR